MPAVITKDSLWEVADVIEQIFRIAWTEDLHASPEDRYAAILDYQAEHRLAIGRMQEALRSSFTVMQDIDQRASLIKLARLYAKHWRVFDADKGGPPAVYLRNGDRPRPVVEVIPKSNLRRQNSVQISSKAVRDKNRYREPTHL
jgi:hypothetical protein